MATFGLTDSSGAAGTDPINRIVGSKFTCPENATADSIAFSVSIGWEAGEKIKCAIYDENFNFLASTSELTDGGTGWITASFVSPPPLTGSTDYILAAWADSNMTIHAFNRGSGNAHWWEAHTYAASWPATITDSTSNYEKCFYCNYTPSQTTQSIALTESVSLTETLSKTFSLNLSESDTLSLGDSPILNKITGQSQADTSTLTDAIFIGSDVTQEFSLTDSSSLSDTFSIQATVIKPISTTDSSSLTDDVLISYTPAQGIIQTEVLTLTDTILIAKTIQTGQTATDNSTLTDTIYISATITTGKSTSDSITLIDTFSIVATVIYPKSASDSITIVDTISISRTLAVAKTRKRNTMHGGEYAKTRLARMTSPTKRLISAGIL